MMQPGIGHNGGPAFPLHAIEGQFSPADMRPFQFDDGIVPWWVPASPSVFKVGNFSTGVGAVATTVAVTGVGFQPKAVMFWMTGQSGVSITGADVLCCFGYATSPTSRYSTAIFIDDNQATTDTDSLIRDDACIAPVNDGVAAGRADLQSMDADGFTLVIDAAFPASYYVIYMAIGGDDVAALAGTFDSPSGAGSQNVTGVGFTPTAGIFMGDIRQGGSGNTYNTISTIADLAIGATDGANPISLKAFSAHAGADSVAVASLYDSAFVAQGSIIATDVTNISDGFGFTWTASFVNTFSYLALKGVQAKTGSFQSRTDTTAQAITGVGFRPKAVIFLSHGKTTFNVAGAPANYSASVGFVDSALNQRAGGFRETDNAGTSAVGRSITASGVYQTMTTADAQDALMSINSLDADGFTFQHSDADSSAKYITYIALG